MRLPIISNKPKRKQKNKMCVCVTRSRPGTLPAAAAAASPGGDGAGEDGLGGPRHDDAVVVLAPVDLERPAGEVHSALAVGASLEHRRHDRGARAGSAREGRPGAALPHAHAQAAPREHLDKLGVGALREGGVVLKGGADGREVEGVDVEGLAVRGGCGAGRGGGSREAGRSRGQRGQERERGVVRGALKMTQWGLPMETAVAVHCWPSTWVGGREGGRRGLARRGRRVLLRTKDSAPRTVIFCWTTLPSLVAARVVGTCAPRARISRREAAGPGGRRRSRGGCQVQWRRTRAGSKMGSPMSTATCPSARTSGIITPPRVPTLRRNVLRAGALEGPAGGVAADAKGGLAHLQGGALVGARGGLVLVGDEAGETADAVA